MLARSLFRPSLALTALVCGSLLSATGCVSQSKYNELRTRYETETEGLKNALASSERSKTESERDSEYYRTLAGSKEAETEALKAKLHLAEIGGGGETEKNLHKLEGTPGIEVIRGGKGVRLNAELLFSSGSANLSKGGMAALNDVLHAVPAGTYFEIDGHTDSDPIAKSIKRWSSGSNFELGAYRALSVLLHLQQQGVPPERMFLSSYGEHRPLDPGDKRKNRRVEIYFFKAEAGGGSESGGS